MSREAQSRTPYNVIASGKERRFEIRGALKPGYDETEVLYLLDDVITAHHEWQERENTILGVTVTPATISYGASRTEMEGRGSSRIAVTHAVQGQSESGFLVGGTINVLYHAEQRDQDVLDQLISLASYLAFCLEQTRIYLTFLGTTYILEQP